MNWQSQVLALLSASLLRPCLLAGAAWLVLRLLKIRHPASQHAVWTAVLIGMFLIPLASVFAPRWKLPILPTGQDKSFTPIRPATSLTTNTELPAVPFYNREVKTSLTISTPLTTKTLIVWCYLAGLFGVTLWRLPGWMLLRRLRSGSRRVRARLWECDDVQTPIAIGVLRPSVILPADWRDWPSHTRRAVLAHEFAHIRRRDTLTSSVTRAVKCIFWFHPLAWWLSLRISDLAELSCDAAVLEKTKDPAGYSRILLRFATVLNGAGHRTAFPGLAMASRSRMSRRIDRVFELGSGNLRKLSRPGVALALTILPAMGLAAVVGFTAPPSHLLHTSAPGAPPLARTAPKPVLVAQARPTGPARPPAPTPPPQPQNKSKFSAAIILPCRGGSGFGYGSSNGSVSATCSTLADLMNAGVARLPGGSNIAPSDNVRQGPEWFYSDRYTIAATTVDPSETKVLQALLEEKFHLQFHTEMEEVTAYDLIQAKDGLKLKPAEPGNCIASMPRPGAELAPDPDRRCGISVRPNGAIWNMEMRGESLANFTRTLASTIMDRRIIDKTGRSEFFTFDLSFARDKIAPGNPQRGFGPPTIEIGASGDSLFTALEKVGLALVPTGVPHGYIVIDHIDRPATN